MKTNKTPRGYRQDSPRRRRKRGRAVVALLAAAVVACTSAALTLPATTMTGDGMENNLGTGTTSALAVDPNAASSETAADSSTPESVAPAVEESAPQSAPETAEESEPVQDPETAEEPAGAPQDTNSDANAITVTDSQDTPSVLANDQYSVAVGETISIEGSDPWGSSSHQWSIVEGQNCVTLHSWQSTAQVTGKNAGTAKIRHQYTQYIPLMGNQEKQETFRVTVTEASSDTSTTESWNDFTNHFNPYNNTVNFYVNLHSTIANSEEETGDTDAGNFTESVFDTRIQNHPSEVSYDLINSEYIIIQGDTSGNAYNVDREIRDLGSTNSSGFILQNIPSDEVVFSRLKERWEYYTKNGGITINDKQIEEKDLTTDNYAIRWYVFKYNPTDNWHIDCILVPKYGRLTVSKTFSFNNDQTTLSEEDLKALVPDNFKIHVASDGEQGQADHSYDLVNRAYSPSDGAQVGYEKCTPSSDGKSITYTWTVDVLNRVYTISESNSDVEGYTRTDATYSTKPYQGNGTSGSLTGQNDSFTIKCETTGTDTGDGDTAQQSASITNNYTRDTGTLTINKEVSDASVTNKHYTFTIATAMPEVAGKIYGDNNVQFSQSANQDGYYIASVTVNATTQDGNDGTITISGLPTGAYIVTEDENSQEIEGYNFISVTYNDGTNAAKADVQKDTPATVDVVNTYESAAIPITIHKVDASSEEVDLQGAQFRLYKKDEKGSKSYYCQNTDGSIDWVTNADESTVVSTADNGEATFDGIPSGTYYLEEIKAPDGYNMLTEAIEITVNDGKVSLDTGHTGNDAVASAEDNNTIVVKNSTGVELPATGSIGTTPFATIGGPLFAVCAVGLGFGLRRRRGKEAK